MGEKLDLVSVIIPAYNTELYIERCIESLINQTYKEIEIIIVDDGSTDQTGDICIKLSKRDSRIVYLKKENGGQGAARNLGIQIAKGEYVTFADADDWCVDTYIENMFISMKKYNSDICVCGKFGVRLSSDGKIISQKVIEQWTQSEEIIYVSQNPNLIYQIKFSLWAKMFRRTLFCEQHIRQPNHKYENNTVIPMLVAKAKTISIVDEPLYYYWMNRQGSTINSFSSYFDMIDCLNDVVNYFRIQGLWDEYKDALYNFTKWNVIHTLNRVFGMENGAGDYERLKNELCAFVYENFPKKVDWINKKVLIWGSYNLTKTVKNLCLSSNIIGNYSYSSIVSAVESKGEILLKTHSNRYRNSMILQDTMKEFYHKEDLFDEIDYVFIDLLEERFSLCKIGEKIYTHSDILDEVLEDDYQEIPRDDEGLEVWKSACDKFVKKILSNVSSDRIILVKYMLSEDYGSYKNQTKFTNLKEIRRINRWLKEAYGYFVKICKGCQIIEMKENNFCFTDKNFEYGCMPCYLNYMVYDQIANKICQQVQGEK